MADTWLIPCNAFRFQPPLHIQWLEKAAEVICELLHKLLSIPFQHSPPGHCALWPRKAGHKRGAAACLAAASLQPSSKLFGLAWEKPPSLGSQGLGLGWHAPQDYVCPSVHTYYISNSPWTNPWVLLKQSSKSSSFPSTELCTCALSPLQRLQQASYAAVHTPIHLVALLLPSFGRSVFNWHM